MTSGIFHPIVDNSPKALICVSHLSYRVNIHFFLDHASCHVAIFLCYHFSPVQIYLTVGSYIKSNDRQNSLRFSKSICTLINCMNSVVEYLKRLGILLHLLFQSQCGHQFWFHKLIYKLLQTLAVITRRPIYYVKRESYHRFHGLPTSQEIH